MKKQFDELDENGDGIITFAELKQGMPLGLAPIGANNWQSGSEMFLFPDETWRFFHVFSTFPPDLEVSGEIWEINYNLEDSPALHVFLSRPETAIFAESGGIELVGTRWWSLAVIRQFVAGLVNGFPSKNFLFDWDTLISDKAKL